MRIVEVTPADDYVQAEMPDVLMVDSDSKVLAAAISIPAASSWGPFQFQTGQSVEQDWDFRVKEDDTGSDLFVRLTTKADKWITFLGLASDSTTATQINVDVVVDVAKKNIWCETNRAIAVGELLVATLKEILIEKVPRQPVATRREDFCAQEEAGQCFECAGCGISFSQESTLSAHQSFYCRRRPLSKSPVSSIADGAITARKRQQNYSDPEIGCPPHLKRRLEKPSASENMVTSAIPTAIEAGQQFATAAAVATLASLAMGNSAPLQFCQACRLFFDSEETLVLHMRFHKFLASTNGSSDANIGDSEFDGLAPSQLSSLVLAAPVLTRTGMHYIPVGGLPVGAAAALAALSSGNASTTNGSSPKDTESLAGIAEQPLDLRTNSPCEEKCLSAPPVQSTPTAARSINVCHHCNIAFYNYDNFLVHKQLYCQNQEKTCPPPDNVNTTKIAAAAIKVEPLQSISPPISTSSSAALVPPSGSTSPTTCGRIYECPACSIRFRSANTLQAHQQHYCPKRSTHNGSTTSSCPVGVSPLSKTNSISLTVATDLPATTLTTVENLIAMSSLNNANTVLNVKSPWFAVSQGYKCALCGYIGQTLRGMKMHSKIHSELGSTGLSLLTAAAVNNVGMNATQVVQPPTQINFTEEELDMIKHKVEPYRRRRSFKQATANNSTNNSLHALAAVAAAAAVQMKNDSLEASVALCSSVSPTEEAATTASTDEDNSSTRDSLPDMSSTLVSHRSLTMCKTCGQSFDQLDMFLRHKKFECNHSAGVTGSRHTSGLCKVSSDEAVGLLKSRTSSPCSVVAAASVL